MARPPKCCGCKYYDWIKLQCDFFGNEIPRDILLEYKKCDNYELENVNYDNDLPIAKGR